jgi:hypothetical protein
MSSSQIAMWQPEPATPKRKKASRKGPKAPKAPKKDEPVEVICLPASELAALEKAASRALAPPKSKKPTRKFASEPCGCAPPSGAGRTDGRAVKRPKKKRSAPPRPLKAPGGGRRRAALIPAHRAAKVTCLSCGGPHTMAEHVGHKYGKGKGRWPK